MTASVKPEIRTASQSVGGAYKPNVGHARAEI